MALNKYLTRTQSLIDDPTAQFWGQSGLINFINEARGQIAAEGQCVKVVPPGTNGIASLTIVSGGAYTSPPTVVFTGPGTGASATAVLTGTAITSFTGLVAGSGYDNTTTVSFTGGGQTVAAVVTPVINALNTVANQEVYTFSSANQFAQLTAGVNSILFVESIAVSWGALKPTLDQWNWNDLQAYVRAYPLTSGQPAMFAQLGQGVGGSIYLQPVPTTALPMEWNCVCLPNDLATDADAEAIPYPWTDAVPYFAAYLAFLNARRPQEAKGLFSIYEMTMRRARAFSEASLIPSYYS